MTAWYYGEDGAEHGPVGADVLAGLVRDGSISASTQLRAEATAERVPARDILPELFQAPAAMPGPGWTETKAHPWRRYFARAADNLVVGGISWILIGAIGGIVAPEAMERLFQLLAGPGGNILAGMLTLFSAIPGNAVMIGLTGLTPGKWVFGVRVLREGRPIGVAAAFSREFEVWWKGLGCGAPFVSLMTLWTAYERLTNTERNAAWDQRQANTVVHRPESLASNIWMWAVGIGAVGVVIWLRVAAIQQ